MVQNLPEDNPEIVFDLCIGQHSNINQNLLPATHWRTFLSHLGSAAEGEGGGVVTLTITIQDDGKRAFTLRGVVGQSESSIEGLSGEMAIGNLRSDTPLK